MGFCPELALNLDPLEWLGLQAGVSHGSRLALSPSLSLPPSLLLQGVHGCHRWQCWLAVLCSAALGLPRFVPPGLAARSQWNDVDTWTRAHVDMWPLPAVDLSVGHRVLLSVGLCAVGTLRADSHTRSDESRAASPLICPPQCGRGDRVASPCRPAGCSGLTV
jgi:hypothetical protein